MLDVAPIPVLSTATNKGEEAASLLRAFPPRPPAVSWPHTEAARGVILNRLKCDPLRAGRRATQDQRIAGARLLLDWLESFPGYTWQQRWEATPAAANYDGSWQHVLAWAAERRMARARRDTASAGMLVLICADVVRPRLEWLASNSSNQFRRAVAATRDPNGFARLSAEIPARELATRRGSEALRAMAQIIATRGGGIDDIVVGDLLALAQNKPTSAYASGVRLAYTWLHRRGQFPVNSPATMNHLATRTGQVSIETLVDRFQLQCRPVRDLLVDYLTERQPALDYSTLNRLSACLVGLFWADLERHNPGIDNLRLPKDVSDAWKARISSKVVRQRRSDGTTELVSEPRRSTPAVKMAVRAFYLDIAHWALDEPERWGTWAAPSPISEAECDTKKLDRQQKATSDQRTRERLPVLPALVRTAERRLKESTALLEAVDAAPLGTTINVLNETFTLPKASYRLDGKPGNVRDSKGVRRNIRAEEKRAFFAWATIEIMRHTGIRIEELLELSHHSIVQYKIPETGEVVPLLQIAPSKTDKERLILVSPELADVLSCVVARVRQTDGSVPSIPTYDHYERIWNAPIPVLFQWPVSGEHRAISPNAIRRALNDTLEASGLVDKAGGALNFQPHDFRRIFITDAVLNGLPPHIAQIIAGHESLNTTMGYAAIYPTDAIEAHRAFISRRRNLRPAEEYRAVSQEEWDEFLGHFERRKLALGECGRAFGTDCVHEHACVRCPVLIVGPGERTRLLEIRDNLTDRISEAEREGWLGEAEGLRVSLAAAEEKIHQLDERQERKESSVFLGIPSLNHIAARISEASQVPRN